MVLLISILTGFGGAIAYALWNADASTRDLQFQEAVLGFAVTKGDSSKNGSTEIAGHANRSLTAGFSVGPQEAEALMSGGESDNGTYSVAVPFIVTMMTSAGYSMDYTITLDDDLDPDSVLGMGGRLPVFFQVDSAAACTVDAEIKDPTPLDKPVSGVTSSDKMVTTDIDYWCMVMTVEPVMYSNEASAVGLDYSNGEVKSTPTSTSTWSAFVLPDPEQQPDIRVTLVPTPTGPTT